MFVEGEMGDGYFELYVLGKGLGLGWNPAEKLV